MQMTLREIYINGQKFSRYLKACTALSWVMAILNSWKKVNTQLDEYVTNKALNGLFAKLAYEEKQIRNDPVARVTDILERVFGKKGHF